MSNQDHVGQHHMSIDLMKYHIFQHCYNPLGMSVLKNTKTIKQIVSVERKIPQKKVLKQVAITDRCSVLIRSTKAKGIIECKLDNINKF